MVVTYRIRRLPIAARPSESFGVLATRRSCSLVLPGGARCVRGRCSVPVWPRQAPSPGPFELCDIRKKCTALPKRSLASCVIVSARTPKFRSRQKQLSICRTSFHLITSSALLETRTQAVQRRSDSLTALLRLIIERVTSQGLLGRQQSMLSTFGRKRIFHKSGTA